MLTVVFQHASGIAFVEREAFAHLDPETDQWSCSRLEGSWRALVVTPA